MKTFGFWSRSSIAKNIFQVHGVKEDGSVAFNRPLRRAQMLPFFAKLGPCLIGMEACSTSHYWGRELTALGHDVKLMPPVYVKPYVKRGKLDAADAEAICEAVTRPTMRFVEIKSVDQQAILSQHRARTIMVGQRTQLSNVIRGLIGEFGITIRKGLESIRRFAEDIENGTASDIPAIGQEIISSLCDQLLCLHRRIIKLDKDIGAAGRQMIVLSYCRQSPVSGRSMHLPLSQQSAAAISSRAVVTSRHG